MGVAGAAPPLTPRVDAVPGARLVFTGRACGNVSARVGDGDPLAARESALSRIGARLEDAVFAEQVHGARVGRVGWSDAGRGAFEHESAVAGADALVTTAPGVAVCVQVADCVPVALATPGGVAAVHAGRQGVLAGVVGAAVAALAEATGGRPADVSATVGPGIGGCCYEVPAEMAVEAAAVVPAARGRTTWGTAALDLPAAIVAQLQAAGVPQVTTVGSCTRCDAQRWFSHRASQAGEAAEGRQLLAVRTSPLAGRSGDPSLQSRP